MNPEELFQFLVENGRAWVQAQRDRHRPTARRLTLTERAAFSPFFAEHILDIARVKPVPLIENPAFYAELEAVGVPMPLDFTAMEGITFVDTILTSQKHHPHDPPQLPLLFHELVHVVQYEILGLGDFIEGYVQGWVEAGQDYFGIPLEQHVYTLQERYVAHPNQGFAVEDEARHLLERT